MSKLQLRIAIWGGKKGVFGATFLGNSTPQQRLERLEAIIASARSSWLDQGGSSALPVLKIFVAPESTLVKSKDERAFAFTELQWKSAKFTQAFEDLSQDLLLLPGTAIWKKPLVKGSSPSQEALEPVKTKHELATAAYYQRKVNFYKEQKYSESGQVDTANTVTLRLKKKFNTVHTQWSPSTPDIYIARNVAYVYFNGRKLMKYYKQGEDRLGKKTKELHPKDKESHTDIKYIPGHEEGSFNVDLGQTGTLRCGLEICVDHTYGQLLFSKGGKNVDLQFLLSDMSHLKKNRLSVRPGGFFVHACTSTTPDTEMGLTGLYDHEGNWIQPGSWQSQFDSELLCYSVELTI